MATYKPEFKNTEATQFVLDEYTCLSLIHI